MCIVPAAGLTFERSKVSKNLCAWKTRHPWLKQFQAHHPCKKQTSLKKLAQLLA